MWGSGRSTVAGTTPAARGTCRPRCLRFEGRPGLGEYLAVDDYDVIVAARMWTGSTDWILADLARR